MEQFLALTKRNIKIYLRDKGAVFFSLLSALIVIGLMVFFLGDLCTNSLLGFLEELPFRDYEEDKKNATLFILAWTSAGILSINAVSVSLAAYSGMIKDRVNGKLNAIYTAPISRFGIALSYITSAWIVSVIICLLTLVLTEVYGVSQGLEAYSVMEHGKLVIMIMINSFTYSALMYPLAVIAKTDGAWSGFGTVVGTLVGFLGGIYIPIGSMGGTIATIIKCTPVIYGTSMFRKVMTNSIEKLTFRDVPAEAAEEYMEAMGIKLTVSDYTLRLRDEWLILLVCGTIFMLAGIWMLKHEKKTDR